MSNSTVTVTIASATYYSIDSIKYLIASARNGVCDVREFCVHVLHTILIVIFIPDTRGCRPVRFSTIAPIFMSGVTAEAFCEPEWVTVHEVRRLWIRKVLCVLQDLLTLVRNKRASLIQCLTCVSSTSSKSVLGS